MTRKQMKLFITKPSAPTGTRTRDLWPRSLDLRPLDQPAVKFKLLVSVVVAVDNKPSSSFQLQSPLLNIGIPHNLPQ